MSRLIRSRWKSNFARFVHSYGVDLLALELEVDPSAIYHWIRGATTPRPAYAELIRRIARKRGITLSMDEIYGHSREVRSGPAVMTRRQSNFELFIRSFGVESLAAELDLHPSTICRRIRGARVPGQAHAEMIHRLALERGARLTIDEIYRDSARF
jgi:hypothetical protein